MPDPRNPPARVGVVIVTYCAERDIEACLASVMASDREGMDVHVHVVDNASADGTARIVRDRFPGVTLTALERNAGFAAANNLGIRAATHRGAELVYLLNPDTVVERSFLRAAVAVISRDDRIAAVQSLLLLEHDRGRVNTWGNAVHVLGFGYCGGYGAAVEDAPRTPVEIAAASGAGSLFRSRALEEAGLFDEELFLYQEDMDLSWRLRLAGWRLELAPSSVVFHKYAFSKGTAKYYYLERNRLLVLAKNLQPWNLALLAPALAAAELGVLVLAARGGWFREKLRSSAHLLRRRAWKHIARGRKEQARIRRVADREIFRLFTPVVEFDGVTGRPVALANAVMRSLWRAMAGCIR